MSYTLITCGCSVQCALTYYLTIYGYRVFRVHCKTTNILVTLLCNVHCHTIKIFVAVVCIVHCQTTKKYLWLK